MAQSNKRLSIPWSHIDSLLELASRNCCFEEMEEKEKNEAFRGFEEEMKKIGYLLEDEGQAKAMEFMSVWMLEEVEEYDDDDELLPSKRRVHIPLSCLDGFVKANLTDPLIVKDMTEKEKTKALAKLHGVIEKMVRFLQKEGQAEAAEIEGRRMLR